MGIELINKTSSLNVGGTSGNVELTNSEANIELASGDGEIIFTDENGNIELVIPRGGSDIEVDDTLSIEGAAADAAATGYAIGELKDELDNYDEGAMVSATNLTPEKRINLRVRNKNVFDVSTISIGYTAESYGIGFNTGITTRANTQHFAAHDNVIVKPDTHYVFSLDNTNYWVYRIIEVDENNLCVRNHAYYATKQDNAVKEFITKETTVKLYIAFAKKDETPATMEEVVALNFQLEVGDTPTPFTPYVDVANREITITGKNIFKPTGGISASDFENKEIGDKMPTEFIEGIYQIHPYTPLKPNTYYTYSTQATRGQGWHGYMAKEIYEADENDIIVAKYSFTPEQPYTKFTFKTTPTTKYMLVNIGGIAFTTGTTLDEKSLKVRDFQFEEGNDESGSDFYYEETYTTDENGCINGIAFPRDKAHAYIKDKGLIIELEVVEPIVQPDWLEADNTSHAFIQNKPTYTTKQAYLSCDYVSNFNVGTNLIMEINSRYKGYFDNDAFTNPSEFTVPSIYIKTWMLNKEYELNVAPALYDSENLYKILNATHNTSIYVIINRDILSDEDKAKFPVLGFYVDFPTQAAIDAKTVMAAKVETVRYTKLDKRYMPYDVAYLSDIPEAGGSSIELDTTLSVSGAAADAMATGEALKGRTTTKQVILDFDTLNANGVMFQNTTSSSASSTYTVNMYIAFVPALYIDGTLQKIIDTPIELVYMNNNYVWLNKANFKRVGLISPAIEQYTGISGIFWFDNLGDIFKTMGFTSYETNMEIRYTGELISTLTVKASNSTLVSQAKGLLDGALASPGNKLIFEYQEQENIEQIEAQYVYEGSFSAINIEE